MVRALFLFLLLHIGGILCDKIGTYQEHLTLEPLPNHALLASFHFSTRKPLETSGSLTTSPHFSYLPRSIGQILQHTHTHELHLRLTQGRWDDVWGSLPEGGKFAGGTGLEIWAWLEGESSVM